MPQFYFVENFIVISLSGGLAAVCVIDTHLSHLLLYSFIRRR